MINSIRFWSWILGMNGDKIGLRALSASLIMHCSFCCCTLTEESQEEGSGRAHPRKEETPEGRFFTKRAWLLRLTFRYFMLFHLLLPVLVRFLLLQNSRFACFVCVNEFPACAVVTLTERLRELCFLRNCTVLQLYTAALR